ncbi:hypothetical protein ACN08Y_10410 [Rothia sp. P5764]|uniref:hypothetical protein n=1 Tax=Rothia sp. P5764 TaxID=3402654 RepID=UPI003ACB7E66
MSTRTRALLLWGLFLTLTIFNPAPTGGAMLLAAPVGVFLYRTTKDWINESQQESREAAEEAREAAGI